MSTLHNNNRKNKLLALLISLNEDYKLTNLIDYWY